MPNRNGFIPDDVFKMYNERRSSRSGFGSADRRRARTGPIPKADLVISPPAQFAAQIHRSRESSATPLSVRKGQ
jgi:hypothetical protein